MLSWDQFNIISSLTVGYWRINPFQRYRLVSLSVAHGELCVIPLDHPSLKFSAKTRTTTCMLPDALKWRSNPLMRRLMCFGKVICWLSVMYQLCIYSLCGYCVVFWKGRSLVICDVPMCIYSLCGYCNVVLWFAQVRKSGGLPTRNWTASLADPTACSSLSWPRLLWMLTGTMFSRWAPTLSDWPVRYVSDDGCWGVRWCPVMENKSALASQSEECFSSPGHNL